MSASAECSLVCVDPEKINAIWPHVEPLLRPVMVRSGEMLLTDLAKALVERRMLLWLAWDGTEIVGACVTELSRTTRGLVCIIVAMGGNDRKRWLHFTKQLEDFARAEKCVAMRLYGRKGWKRVLRDYRETRIILEKELG